MALVLALVGALVLLLAIVACALAVHVTHARRRADRALGPAYRPHSADPRGRWQISRLGNELLEPAPYLLDTDPDDSHRNPLDLPIRQHTPLPESGNRSTDERRTTP